MRNQTSRRKTVAGVAGTLVTFSIGLLLAVLVAGSASASSTTPKKTPKATKTTGQSVSVPTPVVAPADKFSAINGTVNAASDHEIVGSSAFPNYTTGAVDNYYTMAHAHVDNSPFAEGTSSPFDTGPVGQTAAAGNFQQPQYADARWPGGPAQSSYGNQGGPLATSSADNNRAKADASESSNTFSGPGMKGTKTLSVPIGFDSRLQQALSTWNKTWSGRLGMKKAAPPKATTPAVPVTVPSSPVHPPSVTVTTPSVPAVGGVTVPSPKLPSASGKGATRSPASVSLPKPPASLPKPSASPSPGGTESQLSSSTLATLVYKIDGSKLDTSPDNTCKSDTVATSTTGTTATTTTTTIPDKPKSDTCTLVLKGESSMGRVSIGGAIVIEGIHVTASITNDGTPSYDAAVSVASATIGGIPVTIDQNGVHVAGQGQGLPYQQASTALNSALKQAGIQIFLVQPEVTDCGASGSGSGGGTTSTTTSTTSTTSTDQSGSSSACGGQTGTSSSSCDQSGGGSGGTPGLPAPPTSTQPSTTTTPSCGDTGTGTSCDQSGTGTGSGGSTTTTTGPSGPLTPTTTTSKPTTTSQSSTTTTSSCDQSGMTGSSSCTAGSGTSTTTSSNDQSATTDTTGSSYASSGTFQFGPGPGTNNAGEETVTATGVHIVFTQPVSPSGVPAQFVEHILGEVFVDSLATPATALPNVPFSAGSLSPSSSSLASSCGAGGHSGSKTSGSGLAVSGGSSSVGGSGSSGSGGVLGASGSSIGSASQPTGPSTASSVPASFARALKKPLWLLLAYLVWQALVVGTGWSLWHWRRGGAT